MSLYGDYEGDLVPELFEDLGGDAGELELDGDLLEGQDWTSEQGPDVVSELFEDSGTGGFGDSPLLGTLIGSGNRDENDITNQIFFARHPGLPRTPLRKDQQQLVSEWLQIRDQIVRPALRKAGAGSAPPPPPPGSNAEVARSLREAQTSYKSLLARGAKVLATASAGNGGKPVLTVIPPSLANNTDPSKPYQTQIHYHGMRSRASRPSPSSVLAKRIADSFNQQPPTVFVLPEWKAENNWSNVKSTGVTAADALRGVTGRSARTTVSGHSLGRYAIQWAIQNGGLQADRLDMEDAFYSTEPAGPRLVYQWMKQNPNVAVRILLTSTGMSDKRTIQRQAPFPDHLFVDQSRLGNHNDAELKPW